jgi:hypothetical protein
MCASIHAYYNGLCHARLIQSLLYVLLMFMYLKVACDLHMFVEEASSVKQELKVYCTHANKAREQASAIQFLSSSATQC